MKAALCCRQQLLWTWNESCRYVKTLQHDAGLKLSIPTGGPAGTTHFLSGRADGGMLLCLATPSCIIFSTFSSSSRGKGTWCTRRWEPSDGRGTFWNAMWGFGFSYGTRTRDPHVLIGNKTYAIRTITTMWSDCLTFLYSCSESSLMCFCSLAGMTSSSLKLSTSKATSWKKQHTTQQQTKKYNKT